MVISEIKIKKIEVIGFAYASIFSKFWFVSPHSRIIHTKMLSRRQKSPDCAFFIFVTFSSMLSSVSCEYSKSIERVQGQVLVGAWSFISIY